jgi:hypothetical protein
MIENIPIKETRNKYSAARSYLNSLFVFSVRIEINDKTDEMVKIRATIDVNSSINEFSDLLVKCKEVIMNKQKPSRLAAVPKMCCDVLFAIFYVFLNRNNNTNGKRI